MQYLDFPEFITLVKISLFCAGVYVAAWEGMVIHSMLIKPLERLLRGGDRLNPDPPKAWPKWLIKPLYLCLPCMGSVWTIALGLLVADLSIVEILLGIPIVSGLNAVIDGILSYCMFNPLNGLHNENGAP